MPATIAEATQALQQGQVIAYPTEAVFGLGCDPDNEQALKYLLDLKQRPAHKGLILIAADIAQLSGYILPLTDDQLKHCEASWPGPVTWLIPKQHGVSRLLSGEHNTVAVRVTAHPVACELCNMFGKPIVSTSANLAGQKPARSIKEIQDQFADKIKCIVDGQVDINASPSEIRDLKTNKILRGSE